MMKVSLGPSHYIGVLSFKQASEVVLADIAKKGVGSSGWYGRGAGRILVNGKQVAFVSYNGRVWEGVDTHQVGAKEISI